MAKNNFTKAVNSFYDKIHVKKTYLTKSDMCTGNKYRVTVYYNGKRCSFTFHDNYMNKSKKKELLYCLLLDAQAFDYNMDIYDFASSFGYKQCRDAEKAYAGCKRQSERLHKLFTDEEIALLSMIVE